MEFPRDIGTAYSVEHNMSEQVEKNRSKRLAWLAAGVLGTVTALIINVSFLPRSTDPILRGAETLDEIRDIVREKYVKEVDDDALYYSALRGMVSELDPYSTFVSPEDREDFLSTLRGDFGGLGIYVSMKNGILTVIAPIEGTPAFKAGILAGDKILKVDDESVEGVSLMQATKRLKGPPGTDVKLELLHPERTEPVEVIVTRAKIKIQSVRGARMLDEQAGIGYLRITQFQSDTPDEFRKAVKNLKKDGLTKLVLDLRFNPGGVMVAAEKLADEMLKEGIIVSTVERTGKQEETKATPGGLLLKEPVVVLINHGSASASEILAGALQDHGRAITVGTRSFGKGMVQSVFPVDRRQSMLKLTTAYYYTPGGHCVHTGVPCRHKSRFCFHKANKDELNSGGLRPSVEVAMSQLQEEQLRRMLHDREIEQHKKDIEKTAFYDKLIMSSDSQLRRAIQYLKDAKLYDEAIAKIASAAPADDSSGQDKTWAGPR